MSGPERTAAPRTGSRRWLLNVWTWALLAACSSPTAPKVEADPEDAVEQPADVAIGGPELTVNDVTKPDVPIAPDLSEDVATCKPESCDDGNPCTTDGCDTDACRHDAKPGACDDGIACTEDACKDGTCVGTAKPGACEDDNVCTLDSCGPSGCVHSGLVGPCDDGFGCTVGDTCSGSKCQPGKPLACNDANPCTTDTCDASTGGCASTPSLGACEDGSACTSGDVCSLGSCQPGKATDCGDGNPCTVDLCDDATGCGHAAILGPCSDGNPCTTGESCLNGKCPVGQSKDCSDGIACTTDVCNKTGDCIHTVVAGPCDDQNPCTIKDACTLTGCTGQGVTCDDGNSCTTDSCATNSGCAHTTIADQPPCDDGQTCTGDDKCIGGSCQGNFGLCDDGNPCTSDLCGEGAGCFNFPAPGPCDDGAACTAQDHCVAGSCVGVTVACDDGNPCTQEACDVKLGGCVGNSMAGACDDGNPCTQVGVCKSGACQPGPPVVCPAKPCEIASCDVKTGACGVALQPDGSPCSDGSACTIGDACAGGACQPGPAKDCGQGIVCTQEQCSAPSGPCGQVNGASCDADGSQCTGADHCLSGSCVAGAEISCDDGNPCTTDTCGAVGGCSHAPATGACDDANPCTTGDVCNGGTCAGSALACDDGNSCTIGSCDVATGKCAQKATLGILCSDGNPCTIGDLCQGGVCTIGKALSCDDNNGCTQDLCLETGCAHVALPNGATCSDGNACTLGDVCKNGLCDAPKPALCDDGNGCTTDLCKGSTGCQHFPTNAPCSDGSCCTVGDKCNQGVCSGKVPVVCDDGLTCTLDSCQAKTGCTFEPTGGEACGVCLTDDFETAPTQWSTWSDEPKYVQWTVSGIHPRSGLKGLRAQWKGPAPSKITTKRAAHLFLRMIYLRPGPSWLTFDMFTSMGSKSCGSDNLAVYVNGKLLWQQCDSTVVGDGSKALGGCTDFKHVAIDLSLWAGAPVDIEIRAEAGSQTASSGIIDVDNLQLVGNCATACLGGDMEQHITTVPPKLPAPSPIPPLWQFQTTAKDYLAWKRVETGGHTGTGTMQAVWKGAPPDGKAAEATLVIPGLAPEPGAKLAFAVRTSGLGAYTCGDDDLEVRLGGQVVHARCDDHPEWQRLELDVSAWAGQIVDLELRVRSGPGSGAAGKVEVDDVALLGPCSFRCLHETFSTGKNGWISAPASGPASWQPTTTEFTSAPGAMAVDLAAGATHSQLSQAQNLSFDLPIGGAKWRYSVKLLASESTCPTPLWTAIATAQAIGLPVAGGAVDTYPLGSLCAPTNGWQELNGEFPAALRGRTFLLRYNVMRVGTVAPAAFLDEIEVMCR